MTPPPSSTAATKARHHVDYDRRPLLVLALLLAAAGADSAIKGPPHVSGPVEPRRTYRLGDTVKLDCPVRGTPTPIVEWYKDGDSVTAGWERFKPTSHGLRIKEVILDDSGVYTCKGVNGFGSEQVTFEVVIVDPNAKATDPPSSSDMIFGPETETDLATWRRLTRPGSGSAPLLIETSQMPSGRTLQVPPDSTLRLKCIAQGEPEPHLIWFKDGKEIGDDRRIGRWELQVARLGADDSGVYSCKAVNPYGSINASFVIQVLDRSARKPEFVGPFQNVTVLEGASARLQCRVISDTPVYLQWLKRLERLSPYDAHRHPVAAAAVEYSRPDANGVLQFDGWRYQLLQSGHPAYQADDGSYLDKLALDDMSLAHAGVYVCIATNSAGFSYREAIINVIPGPGRALVDVSSVPNGNGIGGAGAGGLPTAAVVALPLGAFAVLALMASIIYYFKSERRIRKEANMAPHHQRHHHQTEIKDLSLTTPCLPRGGGGVEPPQSQPPQPPDSSSIHHRYQPPNCIPYSTPFMNLQQDDLLRIQHHSLGSGVRQMRPCNSPLIGTGTSSSGGASSTGAPLYLGGHGGTLINNWSNIYRPPPCGRTADRSMSSYPYHNEASLMLIPPPPPSESEHAYASVHGTSYEEPRSTIVTASSLIPPHKSGRFQRIEMV